MKDKLPKIRWNKYGYEPRNANVSDVAAVALSSQQGVRQCSQVPDFLKIISFVTIC